MPPRISQHCLLCSIFTPSLNSTLRCLSHFCGRERHWEVHLAWGNRGCNGVQSGGRFAGFFIFDETVSFGSLSIFNDDQDAFAKRRLFLRAESFYNTASYLDENSTLLRYGGVFHQQSHGESFLSLVTNRFEGNGLYILDEPEAALSPQRLMTLIVAIDELVKRNSQLLIATHSPILMAYPNAEILQLTETGIQKVSYKDTNHYQITKQFIDRPGQMIKYLLDKWACNKFRFVRLHDSAETKWKRGTVIKNIRNLITLLRIPIAVMPRWRSRWQSVKHPIRYIRI